MRFFFQTMLFIWIPSILTIHGRLCLHQLQRAGWIPCINLHGAHRVHGANVRLCRVHMVQGGSVRPCMVHRVEEENVRPYSKHRVWWENGRPCRVPQGMIRPHRENIQYSTSPSDCRGRILLKLNHDESLLRDRTWLMCIGRWQKSKILAHWNIAPFCNMGGRL